MSNFERASHSVTDAGWQANAVSDGIPEFMINFCELHKMGCRMSTRLERGVYFSPVICASSFFASGFYADVRSTPAELLENFQSWSRLYEWS